MTRVPAIPTFTHALTNPYLIGLFIVWIATKLYLFFGADLSLLSYGEQDPTFSTIGQLTMMVFIPVLYFLARRQGLKPVDHTSNLGIKRRDALLETLWLSIYMLVTVALGAALNIHTHVGFHVATEGTQNVLGFGPAASAIIWSLYNTVVYVVIPLVYFMGIKKYSAKTLLLGFPKPRIFVPFALIAGLMGFVPFITPEYFTTALSAHLLTALIYFFGTLLPVAIFTQALFAPRLAILTRSWVTGAVLSGVVYTVFNLNGYTLEWGSLEQVTVSVASLLSADLVWGLLKGASTLILGSAWMHIFTTHTLHFADVPAIAKIFGIR